MRPDTAHDVIIIGGGFYGCSIALFLSQFHKNILIVEQENDLLLRASYNNQARVHKGYHYPRNFITASRSAVNFDPFIREFKYCIVDSFQNIYAVSRHLSKVSQEHYYRFCKNAGIQLERVQGKPRLLFNFELIEECFYAPEAVFDATKLRERIWQQIEHKKIRTIFGNRVLKIQNTPDARLSISLQDGRKLLAHHVYNCTYAGINSLLAQSGLPLLPLKNELTEMALIDVPVPLKQYGITVMDGPFFSLMPFPAEQVHSLSHVRYTPHQYNTIKRNNPYPALRKKQKSHYPFMIKDAARFVPILQEGVYKKSLFEIKTVLLENEVNDARPILYKDNYGFPNFTIIMGGKIDNIYDIMNILRRKYSKK